MNNRKSLHTIIILIAVATCVSSTLTLTSLTAKHSNQGYTTDYVFQFVPTYSYQWATVRIDFPVEYILSSFQNTLDCWYSSSGKPQEYKKGNCHM